MLGSRDGDAYEGRFGLEKSMASPEEVGVCCYIVARNYQPPLS